MVTVASCNLRKDYGLSDFLRKHDAEDEVREGDSQVNVVPIDATKPGLSSEDVETQVSQDKHNT